MNKSFLILSIFCMMIANKNTVAQQKTTWPATVPPIAEKKEHVRDIHGDKVSDPYYWMIDYFKKGPDSNTVVKYLEDENAYLKTMMKSTEALQNKLFKEMKGRIKEKD